MIIVPSRPTTVAIEAPIIATIYAYIPYVGIKSQMAVMRIPQPNRLQIRVWLA